jgi:hypothetical protein
LALIARGLTNKEIAHELRITERGVAAHVSRLLLRFAVPNRAGLVAATFAESSLTDAMMTTERSRPPRPRVEGMDLGAFDDSKFLVTITVGTNQVIAYQNKATLRLISGIAPEAMMFQAGRDRFPDVTAARVRDLADAAFIRGATLVAEGVPVRWQNDDGSWDGRVFDWVLQPLLGDHGTVEGILWIGTHRAEGV